MFSRRTAWQLRLNPLSRAIEAQRAAGRSLIDLTIANPSTAGLTWPDGEGLRRALAAPEVLGYTPEPFGLVSAREALAGWLTEHGLPLPIAQLCLTASTSEAYGFLFKLLCDPGEAVLVPAPSYPLFDDLAGLEGIEPIPYRLRYDGEWHLAPGALAEALAAAGGRARALVTIHPNNPTGHYQKVDELEALRECCQAEGLALISDEVFYEHRLTEGRPPAPRAAASDRVLTFSLGGLSKLAGLPQLKLGWIAASGPSGPLAEALARLDVLADTYLSVGAPAQLALPQVLGGADAQLARIRGRLLGNLAALDRALRRAPPITRLRCEGGWTAVLRLPATRSSEGWALKLLDEAQLLVQPGYLYGLGEPDAHLVVSLLTAEGPFSAGVEALARAVAGDG